MSNDQTVLSSFVVAFASSGGKDVDWLFNSSTNSSLVSLDSTAASLAGQVTFFGQYTEYRNTCSIRFVVNKMMM